MNEEYGILNGHYRMWVDTQVLPTEERGTVITKEAFYQSLNFPALLHAEENAKRIHQARSATGG